MKRLLLFGFIGTIIVSCSERTGELTGVMDRPTYQPEIPLGMVYIKSGGFQMGENDQDVPFLHQMRPRPVSVQSFYMDQTEISNNEYRQFVFWVRDSIAREILYTKDKTWVKGLPDAKGQQQKWSDVDATQYINYQDYYLDESNPTDGGSTKYVVNKNKDKDGDAHKPADRLVFRGDYQGPFLRNTPEKILFSLNWDAELDYSNEEVIPLLAEMYLTQPERYYRRREIDTRKLMYRYFWIDYRQAAQRGRINIDYNTNNGSGYLPDDAGIVQDDQTKNNTEHRTLKLPDNPITGKPQKDPSAFEGPGQERDMGRFNKKGQNNAIRGHDNRARFIIDEEINVYPDTLCWVRDFTYSFHDPMSNMYFWHPAYDNYPVVGITWVQAKAFSVWRTQLLNNWLISEGELFVNDFRLPTEAEWERGSRGPNEANQYPWGGPYIRNNAGCFLGNFKPMRGRYFEDGGFHTVKVYSYNPNGWGLYCMAGNVAEWCETAFDESMYEVQHDLNPDYRYDALDWDPPVMKRKVIRGGSWKDIGYYLMNGTRTYEYQDTAKSYIGFRNVMTHLGRGGEDFSLEGGAEEIQSDIQLR
jgi:formylglycine-generating enzyme required for sulfatase activity